MTVTSAELLPDGYYCDSLRHLVCVPYSLKGLHEMAADLNIGRHWFHKDHYDIPATRVDDIKARADVHIVRPRLVVQIIETRGKKP